MFPIRDVIPHRFPPVTVVALILANGFVFLVETSLSPETLKQVFYLFGLVPARYSHPAWASGVGLPLDDYWPFLTSMFLHGGWFHIIANMWCLWLFGDNVEDRMGHVRFLLFYLACGLAAGVIQVLTQADSTLPTVGASGAIAGVMGAYLFLFPFARILVLVPIFIFPFFFELPAVIFMGFWFFMQLFGGLQSLAAPGLGGIAFWAHVGGFAAGVLLHPIFLKGRAEYRAWYDDETHEPYPYRGFWR